MSTSRTDTWGQARQAFADQFEQEGTGFIYRRSQKGEAIRVSSEERDRFIEEFARQLRRATWIVYIGLGVVLGGTILFSLTRGSDVTQAAIFVGIAVAMVPYFIYYQRAWGAPARELAGRTPVAGERSPEEVRRLKFQRITYGQLGIAAVGGLALPFLLGGKENVLSGWNRLWLIFGGALVLLATVQAFRKWQFERDTVGTSVVQPTNWGTILAAEDPGSRHKPQFWQLWRYLPLAIILLGLAFIAHTSVGKRLSQTSGFWPVVIGAFGCWSLFTVARGFRTGQIEPVGRGFYNSYERETQPKRFWASMTWNSVLGGLCLLGVFITNGQASAQVDQDRCYDSKGAYAPQEALSACNSLIQKRQSEKGPLLADALMGRGNARDALHDRAGALADYTLALRMTPDSKALLENRARIYLQERAPDPAIADYDRVIELYPGDADGYDDRAFTYEWLLDDKVEAIRDYSAAIAINPNDAVAFFRRGICYERIGDYEHAVADLTSVIRLRPKDAVAYYFRSVGYRDMGEDDRAASDRATAERLNPKLVAQVGKNPTR